MRLELKETRDTVSAPLKLAVHMKGRLQTDFKKGKKETNSSLNTEYSNKETKAEVEVTLIKEGPWRKNI